MVLTASKVRMILLIGLMKIFREKKHIGTLSRRSAFTLVEIILVVLLLSVITGMTIPNFRNSLGKVKLQNSANHIAYAMRYAQSRAITKNVLVRFECNQTSGNYWLTEQKKDVSGQGDKFFVKLAHKMGKKFSLPDGINIESDSLKILFYKDGRIEKQVIKLCGRVSCFLISTREQRGHVNVFEVEK